ncbi:MAG TPA: glycosyltransferase family 2 protein [Candidatus Goldiibacteriota bacterium]|nr:glycosyltransferase family 2 protein [Candidatus Goldiibacteriota bacterium]HPN63846.1 glycosyltransferase family 2 protein [Candidatus Goldiibacteriota bacterium]HRQ43048.1 glycosyltransferase family 2 protein [Candidatus Goldiibacteriota bacterium]
MKLSVIVPVLNEKNTLEKVIEKLLTVDIPMDKEIIIVDDNSTDGSSQIMDSLYEKYKPVIKVIHKKQTEGKGNAIQSATPLITGDVVIIQDADMEYNIEEYRVLVKPFIEQTAEVVFGSRFMGKIEKMAPQNMIANRILTFLANFLYGLKITDEATAYKLIKADLFRKFKMQAKRFEFCPELLAKAALGKHKITEIPITYRARTVKEGKKIKWHDLITAINTLIRYRITGFKEN